MSSARNSVETVNAAATAIVTAETRVQPSTVQKRRCGSCWSLYWCFGSYKHNKRISHAALVSEPTAQSPVTTAFDNPNHSLTIVMPFITPPSSPASFLQSDPSSATHSPAGLLSLASLSVHSYSPGRTAQIFTIGPYAHETQLVSPPVFSTFTTEPSTASFTPPPELVQMTTPSSPEVPFAQLLSSSLARNQKFSGTNKKLSQCEYQPYQYPGSPGGHIKSPGSAISTSGNTSPFPIVEIRMGEAPKFISYEHFSNYKWGSRFGSGPLTPNGWGSRLGSGTLTPNGGISRLGSGTLTPNVREPPSRDSNLLENQNSEVASIANTEHDLQIDDDVVHDRVSFELIGEDFPTCIEWKSVPSHEVTSNVNASLAEGTKDLTKKGAGSCRKDRNEEDVKEVHGKASDGEQVECHQKHRTISLGSSKDFNFNNSKGEGSDKSTIDCEWWTSDKVVKKELDPKSNWTFFSMLQPGVS